MIQSSISGSVLLFVQRRTVLGAVEAVGGGGASAGWGWLPPPMGGGGQGERRDWTEICDVSWVRYCMAVAYLT